MLSYRRQSYCEYPGNSFLFYLLLAFTLTFALTYSHASPHWTSFDLLPHRHAPDGG
jgi:hypothetical protein